MSTSHAIRARYNYATAELEAWAIINSDKTPVGRIVIRRRATSQGHCVRAFIHVFGHEVFEGVASGGGYYMAGPALESAIQSAWAHWTVPVRARFDPVLKALSSRHVDNALSELAGDWKAVGAI